MLVMAFVMCIGFSSCKKDKGSEISGYYAVEMEYGQDFNGRREVHYFVNHNTVIYYGLCSDNTVWGSVELPDKPGWYYSPNYKGVYTYVIEDNKIFITNGTILTIDNGRLLLDGTSDVLHKW